MNDDARRDHRDVNQDLPVFATDPLAGAGLSLWLPDGAVIRDELQRLAKDLARADGCQSVYSRGLGRGGLFEPSGHWGKFSDDMFPPMPVGGDELVLRPANCPHHALIYASRQRSYRDLPVRLNELGAMFRAERSGVLSGLSRVRQINLDDTHVFCRSDQVVVEAARALRTALRAQEILGLPVDYVRLSRRDDGPAFLGESEQWEAAEAALRSAAEDAGLADRGLRLVDAPGEAAFYGPKLALQGGGGAAPGARSPRPRRSRAPAGGRPRGGGVLRAQARPAGARRPGPRGDHRHRAARLQPARAVRPDLRRRRRRQGTGDDDPPRHRRLHGAGSGGAARALPGAAAAVARPGAGVRPAGPGRAPRRPPSARG